MELAEQLGMPYVYLVPNPKVKEYPIRSGIAILSRHPFVRQEMLDLGSQGRVAQWVQVQINEQPFVLCNGHYYWYPGAHPERDRQVQKVLDGLGQLTPDLPIAVVGDFNGTPETSAIALMRQSFTSAYAAAHQGQEPDYTCPTPLVQRSWKKRFRHTLRNLLVHRTLKPWQGTLDYIFVNRHLQVEDCQLILNHPAAHSPTLYPSDHFGLMAQLKVLNTEGLPE